MPRFDPNNEDHIRIGTLARLIAYEAANIVAGDDYLQDPNKALPRRRTRLRERLWSIAAFNELNQTCSAVLGTTLVADAAEGGA